MEILVAILFFYDRGIVLTGGVYTNFHVISPGIERKDTDFYTNLKFRMYRANVLFITMTL